MQNAYLNHESSLAYKLTLDFLKNYVLDIYIDSTKNTVISNYLDKNAQDILLIYSKVKI